MGRHTNHSCKGQEFGSQCYSCFRGSQCPLVDSPVTACIWCTYIQTHNTHTHNVKINLFFLTQDKKPDSLLQSLPIGTLLMDRPNKFKDMLTQSIVLSFFKLTSLKLEEQEPLKTLNNNKIALRKLGSGFSNLHSALQEVLSPFFQWEPERQ